MLKFKDLYVSLTEPTLEHPVAQNGAELVRHCAGASVVSRTHCMPPQGLVPAIKMGGDDSQTIGISLKDYLKAALTGEGAPEKTGTDSETSLTVAEVEQLEAKLTGSLEELRDFKARLAKKAA